MKVLVLCLVFVLTVFARESSLKSVLLELAETGLLTAGKTEQRVNLCLGKDAQTYWGKGGYGTNRIKYTLIEDTSPNRPWGCRLGGVNSCTTKKYRFAHKSDSCGGRGEDGFLVDGNKCNPNACCASCIISSWMGKNWVTPTTGGPLRCDECEFPPANASDELKQCRQISKDYRTKCDGNSRAVCESNDCCWDTFFKNVPKCFKKTMPYYN